MEGWNGKWVTGQKGGRVEGWKDVLGGRVKRVAECKHGRVEGWQGERAGER